MKWNKIWNKIKKFPKKNLVSYLILLLGGGFFIKAFMWVGGIEQRVKRIEKDIEVVVEKVDKINDNVSEIGDEILILKTKGDEKDNSYVYLFNDLGARLRNIEDIIRIKKIDEGMGGPNLYIGVSNRDYTGDVGYISMKKGDFTYSGEPYDPDDYVAAVNMYSVMRNIKIGKHLIVVRTEYEDDVIEGIYAGPSVNIRVNDIFYDSSNPDRLLLLSKAAANAIGLNKEKGIMKADIIFVPPPKIKK